MRWGGVPVRLGRFMELDRSAKIQTLSRRLGEAPRVWGRHKRPSLLIACMPKSASTFLTRLIAGSIPDMRIGHFVPEYGDREQVLSEARVRRHRLSGRPVVAQHHVRASSHLLGVCESNSIRILVLTRNLPDAIVSLRDHMNNESVRGFLVSVDAEEWRRMTEAEQYRMLAEYALPWYVEFAAGWIRAIRERPHLVQHITYDQVTHEPLDRLSEALRQSGFRNVRSDLLADKAKGLVERSGEQIRLHRGIGGRGAKVFEEHTFLSERLERLLDARPSTQREALRQWLLSHDG